MIRHDRSNATQGGGTAILIKIPLKFKIIQNDKITNFKIQETTIIKIKINNKENLFISAAYAAYGNQKQFNDEFDISLPTFTARQTGKLLHNSR